MDLSVIIPYYNSAGYIQDAINSIEKSTNTNNIKFEVLIINDGSTQDGTHELLKELSQKGYRVYTQPNAGPAAARNKGIEAALGKYILFLDSDNKIKETFIETGLKILESNTADIVYGKPVFFGDSTVPRFLTGKFDINRILIQNYIDTCCIIKKEVCINIGGFDEDKRIIGMEDWEFYIRLFGNGYRMHYINSEVYYYRILENSLSQRHSANTLKEAYAYIYAKHAELVSRSLLWYKNEYEKYTLDQQKPVRTMVKQIYKKHVPVRIRQIVSNLLFS